MLVGGAFIFNKMCIRDRGLAAGMGYLGTAMLLMIVSGGITILLISLPAGRAGRKELKITIPENLDYSGIFDDIFAKYTKKSELVRVRTVNMGSLYELCYQVDLKSEFIEKNMLDEIRLSLIHISGVSRWLMHRSSVLFPEPLGPMITTTSPLFTVRDTSFRTSRVPKYL